MKLRDLVPGSWSGEPLTLSNLYSMPATARAIATTRVVPKTVKLVDPITKTIYGKRTIMSK
jgi:hypothetical protein